MSFEKEDKWITLALSIENTVNPGTGAEDETASEVTNNVLSNFASIMPDEAQEIELGVYTKDEEPVAYDYATIEVMANKEKTKGMKFPEDFNKPEVIVALRTGSTPVPVAKKVLPKATFRLFDDEAPAVQDVLSGRADVMFSSAPLPAFEVLRNPDKLYQPSTEAFYRQPVGMAIRKGDPDSLNVLDNWIRMVEEEGWLADRRHYWFKTTDWEAQVR